MVQEIARTFGVDWPHLTAQVISFSIVCGLLYRLAYKPVLAMLEARRQQIAQGIANQAKIDAALAAIEGERHDVVAAAHTEATRIVADARETAARLRSQEIKRAAIAAEQVLTKARDAATLEHERMLGELRGEVGRLVIQTTAAVAGKVLTAEDQRRLAEETASRLAAA